MAKSAGDGGTRPAGRVIWTRDVDEEQLSQRWRKLGRWYGIPVAVVLILGLALGGVGAFLGLLILLGLFSLLVVGWVFFKNHNARANATIELTDDGHLVLGRRHIELARIESWSTRSLATDIGIRDQAVYGNPMGGNAISAKVLFRLALNDDAGARVVRPDGTSAFEIVAFAWAEMSPEHLEDVRTALAPHIPAPWIPPDDLRD